MLINKFFNLLCALLLFSAGFAGNAMANGFDQNNIGARGGAMASAFTAVADDATAIYYNPGGMTAIKDGTWNYEVDLYTIFSGLMWEDQAGTEHKSDEIATIPGLFVASSSGNLSYGIGIYAPYGGGDVKYDTGFEATIAYFALTPSIAYKITPELSAGVGVSVYYGILEMTMPGIGKVKFDGISGWGWYAGLMYKATEDLNLGLTVKSQVPIKMKGNADLNTPLPQANGEYDAEVEFKIPFYYTAGIGFKITPDILIDLDFWYMQWSKMDKLTLTVKNNPVIEEYPIKTYYDNSYDAMIGVEYSASRDIRINAGLKYEKQVASKDEGVSIALNCETDRYTFAAGLGYSIMENFEIAMTLGYAYGVENEVNLGGPTDGTYSQVHKSILLGVRGNF